MDIAEITMQAWGGGQNTIKKFMERFGFASDGNFNVTELVKYRLPCTPGVDKCPISGYGKECPSSNDDCSPNIEAGQSCCPPIGVTPYSSMNAIFGFPQILYDIIKADPNIGYAYACARIATVWSFSDPAFYTNKDLAPALLKKS